jgi:hypothetical protein
VGYRPDFLNFGKLGTLWIADRALLESKVIVEEVRAEILRPAIAVAQLRDALEDGRYIFIASPPMPSIRR